MCGIFGLDLGRDEMKMAAATVGTLRACRLAEPVAMRLAVVGIFKVGKVRVRYSRDAAILLTLVEAAFS